MSSRFIVHNGYTYQTHPKALRARTRNVKIQISNTGSPPSDQNGIKNTTAVGRHTLKLVQGKENRRATAASTTHSGHSSPPQQQSRLDATEVNSVIDYTVCDGSCHLEPDQDYMVCEMCRRRFLNDQSLLEHRLEDHGLLPETENGYHAACF